MWRDAAELPATTHRLHFPPPVDAAVGACGRAAGRVSSSLFLVSLFMRHYDLPNLALRRGSRLVAVVVALSTLAILGCATPPSKQVGRNSLGAKLQQRGVGNVRPDGASTGATAQLPPGVSLHDVTGDLNETAAVAIALWNNAAFQENLAKLGLARADLAQAGLLANPTLSVLFPIGARQLELVAALPLEALWLRPQRIALAEQDAERVAQGLVQHGLDLARDVKHGLSELALAAERAELAARAVQVREEIAGIAQIKTSQRGFVPVPSWSAPPGVSPAPAIAF